MRDDGTIQPAKVTHFTQQGYQIKGIMHAGMNDGEEVYSYKDLGIQNILGFEPLPFAAQKARDDHGVRVEEIALGNKNGTETLIVTKGDGKGSSIYEPILESEEVKKHWTDNGIIVDRIKVKVRRFVDWYEESDINIQDYDCLVLDTQGNEMEVLLGMEQYLHAFRFLSIELSSTPVYEGETAAAEVCGWLKEYGFTQDTEIQSHNDVFFIRKDIKPSSILEYRGLA
jgi:FkbM family methyltransferase